ncbi:phosphoenolpyruvate--protein phosphotransferase [Varunaivibrio sulfuroxidans]|uniref:phosphoenolpyruvate--protein phosphotransferase n=1 Tax=Varunaivibrio sulfuroxidans TaxID=1773489 RepID=A0A4R3JGR1_9PROT|nr:phosphoenolpyruvate--protein phosphotransferase [Varunaivibrio sulfuroxidans]TCS65097.1 phosphotransferase system enzyme I (PtsP) [Varunaivibrio sulfuroxidans]WES29617.1 phosphoenolpyruvate--protein phosphotransferase [Varunaivibrio sulfuroxidans]
MTSAQVPFLSPRRLLARVRDVMASAGLAQDRLNNIVTIIATDMVAEVCSIYVRRAGDVLELFATQGLHPEAVHNTRLRVGEGLVGEIAAHARPLALSDAQKHAQFVFRPETGEESYQSLMGVPILRAGRVIGVLSVQNRSRRQYTEEETETLQTVAMVLAEMVAGGELINAVELTPADGIAIKPLRLEGVRFNSGLGLGTVVLHQPHFHIERMVGEDPEVERERLAHAFSEMHGALDSLLNAGALQNGGEHTDVLQAYRLIAEDAGWLGRIEEAIESGLTAEAGVQKVQNDIRARLGSVNDPYLRERLHDFDDLANRLIQFLIKGSGVVGHGDDAPLPEHVILVARNMGPAQLLDYDQARLRALVLEEGSATSHVVIIAKALDIPVVGNVRDIMDKIADGETAIVDGANGQVFVRPGEDVQQAFLDSIKALAEQKAEYAALKDVPARTRDRIDISLNINAGLLVDFARLHEIGADGVGLYRTEVPFMVRADFPDVAIQRALYAKVIAQAGGKPVVFRTLDIGGDKVLPYWGESHEENPAMGWRAIRMSLDRPALLRQQLRALLQACAGVELNVMFPMVADVLEFDRARTLLDLERRYLRARDIPLPRRVNVGVMFEVPSLFLQMEELLARVDFVSIGSNDLFQFLYACDRGNPALSARYDVLSAPFLSFLRTICRRCDAAGVSVSLCGEMAGRPLEALALIGIGFRRLSIPPPAVGPVKEMVRAMHVGEVTGYLDALLRTPHHSIRNRLKAFARDHGVAI